MVRRPNEKGDECHASGGAVAECRQFVQGRALEIDETGSDGRHDEEESGGRRGTVRVAGMEPEALWGS